VGIIESIDKSDALISKEKKDASTLYYPMGEFAKIFMPMAQYATQHYINNNQEQEDAGTSIK
jgi:hypothetical protein